MKDFRDKELYDSEIGRFNNVIQNRVLTQTEYNTTEKYSSGKEEEEIEDGFDIFGGEGFSLGDLSSGNMGPSPFDSFDGGFNIGDSSAMGSDSWRMGKSVSQQFLYSLFYLSSYVFDDITDNPPKKEEWEPIMGPLSVSSGILTTVSLLSMFTSINTPHIPIFGALVGLTGFTATSYLNWTMFKKGWLARFKGDDKNLLSEDGENMLGEMGNELDNVSDPFQNPTFGGLGEMNFSDDDDEEENSFGDFLTKNLSGSEDNPMGVGMVFNEEEPEDISSDDDDEDEEDILAPSHINTKNDDLFAADLLRVFKENQRYQGVYFKSRKETLDSFAKYLVSNDKKFAKWKKEREHSLIYDNIAYTIYKVLIDINKSFESVEDKFTIMSIQHSPLMYKVELILPQKYFKPDRIQMSIGIFENYLKSHAGDTQVQCAISSNGNQITVRFLRLDYKGLISIGDILRYRDDSGETAYEKFINPKMNTPMLVGLRDNEYPHIVDLENNTAMAIVGGSGSGKSWLTYEIGTNIVTANDYNEVNFIVLDLKNAQFWQAFARMPHVMGYHTDINNYLDIAREVEEETKRRQRLLNEYEFEDFVEARRTLKSAGKYDELKKFPLLIFVIDEITSTMDTLEMMDEKKETLMAFRSALQVISQMGRSAGVRLLTVGQRSIDKSLPKNVLANTSMKFGMKMNAESDFGILYSQSKEVERMKKPTGAGQGIMNSEDMQGYHSIKTLTPGGKDTPQIRKLLRVIAFDWVRRAYGRDNLYTPPIGADFAHAYNRPKFLDMTYSEMADGRIIERKTVSKGYEVDLTGNPHEQKKISQYDTVFSETKREEMVKQFEEINSPKVTFNEVPDYDADEVEEVVWDSIEDEEEDDVDVVVLPKPKVDIQPKPEKKIAIELPDIEDFINSLSFDDLDSDEEEAPIEVIAPVQTKTVEKVVKEPEPIVEDVIDSVDDSYYIETIAEEDEEDDDYSIFGDLFAEYEEDVVPEMVEKTTPVQVVESLKVVEKEPVRVGITETKPVTKVEINSPVVSKPEPKKKVVKEEPISKPHAKKEIPVKKPVTRNTKPVSSGVEMDFKQVTTGEQKETPNMSIQEYIFQFGAKQDAFTYAIPKEILEKVYKKRQIDKSLRMLEIIATKDSYVTSI